MTLRPFIRSPLWAAIAAQEFNIDFSDGDSGTLYLGLEGLYLQRGPFYIHPDSLSDLNGKHGDLGIDKNNHICEYIDDSWMVLGYWDSDSSYPRGDEPVRIIMRDGKPFPPIEWEEICT